jgi:hypothetical protein
MQLGRGRVCCTCEPPEGLGTLTRVCSVVLHSSNTEQHKLSEQVCTYSEIFACCNANDACALQAGTAAASGSDAARPADNLVNPSAAAGKAILPALPLNASFAQKLDFAMNDADAMSSARESASNNAAPDPPPVKPPLAPVSSDGVDNHQLLLQNQLNVPAEWKDPNKHGAYTWIEPEMLRGDWHLFGTVVNKQGPAGEGPVKLQPGAIVACGGREFVLGAIGFCQVTHGAHDWAAFLMDMQQPNLVCKAKIATCSVPVRVLEPDKRQQFMQVMEACNLDTVKWLGEKKRRAPSADETPPAVLGARSHKQPSRLLQDAPPRRRRARKRSKKQVTRFCLCCALSRCCAGCPRGW